MGPVRHLPASVPLRTFVAGLAAAIAAVITTGSLFLVTGGEGRAIAAERSRSPEAGTPAPRPDRVALVPDATLPSSRPVVGGPGESAKTGKSDENGESTEGADVKAAPPTLMAIAPAKVPAKTLRKIAKLPHVTKVAAVDGGTVRVSGTALRLLAVEPARFRSWTPEAVARHPDVWSALTGDEFVADRAAVKRLGMVLGAEYQLDGGPRLRLAASAALGLPGVDGVIGKELGRRLGLAEGVVVLIRGDAGLIDRSGVRRLLGGTSKVVAVRSAESRETPAGEGPVGRPESYLELYQRSAELCPGLSWTVLAAIGQVESGHGRNNGPSSAGALGPMQFMPATWKAYGVDGDGDGETDVWSAYDAVPSAAKYLCANGAGRGGEKLRKAVWFYNHSWAYVDRVLSLADAYARTYS